MGASGARGVTHVTSYDFLPETNIQENFLNPVLGQREHIDAATQRRRIQGFFNLDEFDGSGTWLRNCALKWVPQSGSGGWFTKAGNPAGILRGRGL